jgi:hypothetical protein
MIREAHWAGSVLDFRVAGDESSRPQNAFTQGHAGTPTFRGVEDSAPATHNHRKAPHENGWSFRERLAVASRDRSLRG